MLVALVGLAMVAAHPAPQAPAAESPPPARRAVAATRLAPALPVARYSALSTITPSLREATICALHMELLIERVSARGDDIDAPVWLVQEYWLEKLPDPDGEAAISGEVLTRVKSALASKAQDDPDLYNRQLQACVTEAARGGALLN